MYLFLTCYLIILIFLVRILHHRTTAKSFRNIAKQYKKDLVVDPEHAIASSLLYDAAIQTRISPFLNGIKSNHIVPDIIYKRNNVYIRIAGQWVRV